MLLLATAATAQFFVLLTASANLTAMLPAPSITNLNSTVVSSNGFLSAFPFPDGLLPGAMHIVSAFPDMPRCLQAQLYRHWQQTAMPSLHEPDLFRCAYSRCALFPDQNNGAHHPEVCHARLCRSSLRTYPTGRPTARRCRDFRSVRLCIVLCMLLPYENC